MSNTKFSWLPRTIMDRVRSLMLLISRSQVSFLGRWVRQRCHISYDNGASSWDWLTVGQGLLSKMAAIVAILKIYFEKKKGKRKVQGVPQSQTAALPRHHKEEEMNKSKQANKHTKSTKISSLFPRRGNRNAKRTEKHKNKMTQGKTWNKSPCRINHKATKSKPNTWTIALERSVEGV